MASTAMSRHTAGSAAASRYTARSTAAHTVLLEEIWEEIFLRLDAAADLVRASATCSSFHHIISARQFLRRFRSLHHPALVGFIRVGLANKEFLPVAEPHRSAPEARALMQAADFTFSFLPDPHAWGSRHARDGRALFAQRIPGTSFEDFIVCDPLYRRYVKIPRIPDDLLAASTPRTGTTHSALPILAPALRNDEEESFRIICTVQLKDKVVAFVFSSCNQTWTGITSKICLPYGYIGYMSCYAHGCVYWMVGRMGNSLMLDISEMKFSVIDLPPHNFDSARAIVEAGEGRLGFLTVGHGTIDLYCKNWQSNGVGAQEWQHDKLIPLTKDSGSGIYNKWARVGTEGRYVVLLAYDELYDAISYEWQISEYFVLDIKTLHLEKLCSSKNGVLHFGFPYAGFPPPLALPSI